MQRCNATQTTYSTYGNYDVDDYIVPYSEVVSSYNNKPIYVSCFGCYSTQSYSCFKIDIGASIMVFDTENAVNYDGLCYDPMSGQNRDEKDYDYDGYWCGPCQNIDSMYQGEPWSNKYELGKFMFMYIYMMYDVCVVI